MFTGEERGAWGEDCGMHGGAWRKLSKGFRGIEIGVMTAQCVWWRHFKSEDFESEIEGKRRYKMVRDSEFRYIRKIGFLVIYETLSLA